MKHSEQSNLQFNVYGCDSLGDIPLYVRTSLSPEHKLKIRALHTLEERRNWKIVAFIALWATAAFVYFHIEFLPVRGLALFLMGCAVSGLPVFMHDSCHQTLFRNKTWNRWVGFLCGLPGLVAVTAYRSVHLVHHSRTRKVDDPDDLERSAGGTVPITFAYYFVLLFGIYFYIAIIGAKGYSLGTPLFRKQILEEYVVMTLIYGCVLLLTPFDVLFSVWLLPLLIAGQLANVRGLAEHGLTNTGNEFLDTRTVLSNGFVSWMMNNLNYHLEHHLFPAIPWYNLPKVHALLGEMFRSAGSSVYRSYTAFLVDFVRVSLRRKIVPNTRLIPAHLREELCL